MALVTFIGDRKNKVDHNETTHQYGIDFVLDEPVEVTNPHHLAKFRGNRFFDVLEDSTDGDAGNSDGSSGKGSAENRSSRDRSRKPAD